jgi:hypothetical protein
VDSDFTHHTVFFLLLTFGRYPGLHPILIIGSAAKKHLFIKKYSFMCLSIIGSAAKKYLFIYLRDCISIFFDESSPYSPKLRLFFENLRSIEPNFFYSLAIFILYFFLFTQHSFVCTYRHSTPWIMRSNSNLLASAIPMSLLRSCCLDSSLP